MKVGMVCPYNWNAPGGVRSHIIGLSEALRARGHEVALLTPTDDPVHLPDWATSGGRPIKISYNGSVAGLSFGVRAANRVRRWVRDGNFDVLHVHEPLAPSLSILACWAATGPMVGTWHLATDRSRMLSAGYSIAQTAMEKLSARIAVSEDARYTLVSHVGGDAVLIPNGISTSEFEGSVRRDPNRPTLLFLGRMDETRKGLEVLIAALPQIVQAVPNVHILIAGPGDITDQRSTIPNALLSNVEFLGQVTDTERIDAFHRADIYVAPHLGGESFGIVLVEAMAAGTPVIASDLPAFRRVLGDGQYGEIFERGNPGALADATIALLGDSARREALIAAGHRRAQVFDWDRVVDDVIAVYDSVRIDGVQVTEDLRGQLVGRLRGWGNA
jgi:phosphatidylinositol alpha-mannosyltransferase